MQLDELTESCVLWIRCIDRHGYGRVGLQRIHRIVWEVVNGPIAKGMVIDHQCRNRNCFNVEHLRVVSQSVNATENSVSPPSLNKQKTHCVHGHEFTPENTAYFKQKSDGHTGRKCKTCQTMNGSRNYYNKYRVANPRPYTKTGKYVGKRRKIKCLAI